jgi:metal-responsive CopG/Arc/MetJ family transcriptional regulator
MGVSMAPRRISIRLSPELQEGLDRLVAATGRKESDVVREAILAYCQQQAALPSCYDLAKRSGLIGCVEGGPDDVSTNPAYMEGFGK